MSWSTFWLFVFLGVSIFVGQLWLDSGKITQQVTPGTMAVATGEGVLAGDNRIANEQGIEIMLNNNPIAHEPTWNELMGFLMVDQTDRQQYIAMNFTCGDYAKMLHDKAEVSQIRAAFVVIQLGGIDITKGDTPFHALNAFQVVDRGLVYIDDTGTSTGQYADKQVELIAGGYKPVGLFPELGQAVEWESMGTIERIIVLQW